MLLEFVRDQVMDELGFQDQIDPGQPLNELGLDSLMSVNVANRLESALAISVPVVKLIRGSSLDQLVDDVLPRLAGVGGGPPAVAAEGAVARAAPEPSAPARTARPGGDGWLVWPHPNPSARARLFCFPFAGAGAATYRAWTESLHPSLELVAVEPPGRGARIHEPAVNRLEPFLDALVPALQPYLDKPCAFFGHCLGGLTLFETARRVLEDSGDRLEHVFVSGTRPPHRVAAQGPFEEALLAHLLAQPAFDPFLPAHEQPDGVFAEFIRRFNIGATDELLNNAELRGLLLPSIRADFALAYHYRFRPPAPWAVPITAFVGLDDPYVTREDALEWSRYSNVAFRLLMREGAHFLVAEDRAFIVDTINRELTS
jgi:surfactin synthase thioesterase subunit/acyl carrier protein